MTDTLNNNFPKAKGKKVFNYIIIVVVVVLALAAIYLLIQRLKLREEPLPTERTLEDVLKDLTAPEQGEVQIPEEVLQNLTAPEQGETQVSEEVLQDLTAPAQ